VSLPLERAAFLLHDVFGSGFDEVAAAIERDAVTCRQPAARARTHIRQADLKVEKHHDLALAEAFFAASRRGDMKALRAMLATAAASVRQHPNRSSASIRS
jgi:RNA polymerase sigma-70 factor, ECF subfamily